MMSNLTNQEMIKDTVRLMMAGMNLRHCMLIELNLLKEHLDCLKNYCLQGLSHELKKQYLTFICRNQTRIDEKKMDEWIDRWNKTIYKCLCDGEESIDKIVDKLLISTPKEFQFLKKSMHEKIVVSACIAGVMCKYSGGNNYLEEIELIRDKIVLICPELQGGLPCPRDPAEIVGDQVISNQGRDVTDAYHNGALKALRMAEKNSCTLAVLKAKSPSCGINKVYDGTFTRTLVKGNGIAAELFLKAGFPAVTEEEFQLIIKLK